MAKRNAEHEKGESLSKGKDLTMRRRASRQSTRCEEHLGKGEGCGVGVGGVKERVAGQW